MSVSFTKNHFWPRPKDQNHDTLLRTVAEIPGISIITAVAVFDDKLYVAGTQPGANAPLLFEWDEAAGTLTQITLPAPIVGVGAPTQITGMVTFNNRLWIVTGLSNIPVDNGLMYALDTGGTWTNAVALGFPGWTGGAVIAMLPRLFIYGGRFVAAAEPNNAGPNLEFHYFDGTAWALETTTLANDITSTQQVEDAAGNLFFAQGANVRQRSAAGVYSTVIVLDGPGGFIFGGLASLNQELWVAQTGNLLGTLTPAGTIAQATPAAAQKRRALRTGITAMIPISSAKEEVGRQQVMLAATTSLGSQVYNSGNWAPNLRSELVLIEDGLSIRPLVNLIGWATFIIQYRQYYYVAHGAPLTGVPVLPTSTEFTARLSVIE